ncbi:hypothetical protein [Cryobacterium sp. TMT3-29-2]|uniref:hypothetical protein n=1 Tax=Cryobacterium sp. TMT3-29-2 TaxID=2555867 RepID=UPI00107306CA|nr:hypothetical protein [Cryobacterium sp. TMT3-29-2]TFC83036.1 hypothetical protein E3O67_15420 [Cryobacterium sp. TMT3-29-2]
MDNTRAQEPSPHHSELEEDTSDIDESETPAPGAYRIKKKRRRMPKGTHDQVTRQLIAFTVLGLLALPFCAVILALICNWIDGDKFTMAVAAISGPQALAAAVIGFYYGKNASDS